MAAIFAITGKLKKMQQWPVVTRRFYLSTMSRSPAASSVRYTSFYSAFHRTGCVHRRNVIHFPRLVALNGFSTHRSISQTFDFPLSEIRTLVRPYPGLIDLIRRVALLESEADAMASLEESSFDLNHVSLYSLISEFREEWRLALLTFKWGEKRGCCSQEACDLMIWVLGNHQKFNIAWCLIRNMFHDSRDTRKAMFLMMDRYAAANDVTQAIRTFHIMDKFRHTPDEEAFHGLLYALCRHGNIEEAEEFMLANRRMFPLDVEGFNIILNGWCNIWVDVSEAKRIWREMGNYCIQPNKDSYTHLISCFSKVGNLFDALRLYDEMKKRGLVPGIEVYNSLVYVLTLEDCFDEALKIVDKMKELGLKPNSVTYNSMIRPLCKAEKLDQASSVLATMVSENRSPTVDTFHAFLEAVDFDQTLEVMNRMKFAGLGPNRDSFLLILGKFFKGNQPENALKIWTEGARFEIVGDRVLYIALIEGLVTCGWLATARELYSEMRSKGFKGDPKLRKLLQKPVQGNGNEREQKLREGPVGKVINHRKGSSRR